MKVTFGRLGRLVLAGFAAWQVSSGSRLRRRRRAGLSAQQVDVCCQRLGDRVLLSATVATGQPDYPPGSTAFITASNDANPGTNFLAGETVRFHIERTDGVAIMSPPAITDWGVTDGVGGFAPYHDSTGMLILPDTDGAVNSGIGTS